MCLGVPGKVIRWIDRDPTFARADVEFEGIRRECYMACVPEANEGDYVIVHAGVAICQLDPAQADRVLHELREIDSIEDGNPSFGEDALSEDPR